MYPSKGDLFFGSFIKNIEEGFLGNNVSVDKIVICGQGLNLFDKIRKYLSFYVKIIRVSFEIYDFVHLSYPSHTIIPILFKRKYKSKLIVRFHGLEIVSDREKDFLLFFRRCLSKVAISIADVVVVPSEYFKKIVVSLHAPRLIYKYPSGGVNRTLFSPSFALNDIRSELIIGYVGRIDTGKGLDVLIEACSRLPFAFKLVVVGSGPLYSKMLELSKNNNLNAEFVGPIANNLLVDYYRSFDVLVFPTMRVGESFGNVGIESMSCGTPVIGSDFAGLSEYLVHKYNGFSFEVGSVDSLIERLVSFKNLSLSSRIQLQENCLETSKRFDRGIVTRDFIKFLRDL